MDREHLVMNNIPLGIHYWKKNYSNIFTIEEAYSITYHALLAASKNWDESKSRFSTYAYFYLRKYFTNAWNDIEHHESIDDVDEDTICDLKVEDSDAEIEIKDIESILINNGISQWEWDFFKDKYYYDMTYNEMIEKYQDLDVAVTYKMKLVREKIRSILNIHGFSV